MVTGRYREEVFNVILALLLHERGVVTAPEQSLKDDLEKQRHVPDVLVDFMGTRTFIEGKIDDQPNAREKVMEQARERVESGLAHICLAVVYPASLRQAPFSDLMDTLRKTTFRVAVSSEAGEREWAEGGVDYVVDILQLTLQQLREEDVVTKVTAILNEGVTNFARSVYTDPALLQKAAEILEIRQLPRRTRKRKTEDEDE